MTHRPPRALLAAAAAALLAAPLSAAGQAIDVVELTVEDVQAGYASGRFMAVDLTRAFFARISRYEERYNAFISMNPAALDIAGALDEEYARSGPRGPLHGVPVVIKDNIDYGGLVTTAGWEGFSAAKGGIDMIPDDDAADLMLDLEPGEQRRILDALSAEDAGDLIGLLRYDEDSAGGLMTTELVAVEATLSAGQAIEQVRHQGREVDNFYTVFVVDGERRLQGTLRLDDLITAEPDRVVSDLVQEPVATVGPHVDQEEVGRLIARYNLVAMPVVSDDGVLLGRITFDDVIDVIEAEQTEDILLMAGLGSDEEALRYTWRESVRARMPWLFVNLLTATLAAGVVYLFSETIESVVILAAIMPIVAGLGGNAGTQALAVTVRSIAVEGRGRKRPLGLHVGRELAVGLIVAAGRGREWRDGRPPGLELWHWLPR